ncbi:MAG: nicotinate-nucleotide adenylyltransferase [Betaproteobacteria bacterium]
MRQCVGILGGTFDPIHMGHLRLAQEVAEAVSLTQVLFIPVGEPPHRPGPQTSGRHRAQMVRCAIQDNALFAIDERETQRTGPSYTVQTLRELRHELGPQTPLCMIVGADAFLGLPGWYCWEEIFTLAHVVVAHRPRSELTTLPFALAEQYGVRHRAQAVQLQNSAAGGIFQIPITALDISATDVRTRLQRHLSVKYLVPQGVIHYINEQQLFKG